MNRKFIIHHSSFIIRKSMGFTLVELAVVSSIILTLLGFVTINLARSQQSASLTSVEEILVADLRQQQLKSMIGDTEGRDEAGQYGIHFDSNKYVLFHGLNYSAPEPTNSTISLTGDMRFNNFGFNIIFEQTSGEVYQYTNGLNVVIKDATNGNTKTIMVNKYGVITGVN